MVNELTIETNILLISKNAPRKGKMDRRKKRRKKLSVPTRSQRLDVYRKSSVWEAVREADLLIPLTPQERIDTACQFRGSNSSINKTEAKSKPLIMFNMHVYE